MSNFDVVIVGASLAGSACAIELGHRGFKVALLDKATFPREKACGEGLSALGLSYLERLGIRQRVEALPHARLDGYAVDFGDRSMALPFDGTSRYTLGIARRYLDKLLLDAAVESGNVSTRLGVAVRDVACVAEGVQVQVDDDLLRGHVLVLADGANSVLAERLGVPTFKSVPDRFGLRVHAQLSTPHNLTRVNVSVRAGYEIYCTPVSARELNINVLAGRDQLSWLRQEHNLHETVQAALARLGLDVSHFGDVLGAGPLGKVRRRAAYGRVLCIGDCAETFDPIGGMGMTHALLSATLAAQQLTVAQKGHSSWEQAASLYSRARWTEARAMRGFTRVTGAVLRGMGNNRYLRRLANPAIGQALVRAVYQNGDDRQSVPTSMAKIALALVGGL